MTFRPLSFSTVPDKSVIVPMFERRMIYDDLRVVDLTDGIAGAYCAKLLTDLGADVVFSSPIEHVRCSPICAPRNVTSSTSIRGSRTPTWSSASSMPAGVRDPLVYVSISSVGHGGPDDGLVLTDEVLQARSGSLAGHGHANRPPLTVGGRLGEFVTGAYAALGAATAWHRASRTGVAETVDVSMLEAIHLTFMTTPTLMARFPGGRLGERPLGDDSRATSRPATIATSASRRSPNSSGSRSRA